MLKSKSKWRYILVAVTLCVVTAAIIALLYQNRSSTNKSANQQLKASAAAESVENEAVTFTTEASADTMVTDTVLTTISTSLTTSATATSSVQQITETFTTSDTVATQLISAVSTNRVTLIGNSVSETKQESVTTESETSATVSELNFAQSIITVNIPAEFAARHFVDLPAESNWTNICFSEDDAYFLAAVNGFDLDTVPPAGRYKVPTGIALTIPSSWQDENGIRVLPPGINIQVYQTPEEVDPEDNPLNAYLIPAEIEISEE